MISPRDQKCARASKRETDDANGFKMIIAPHNLCNSKNVPHTDTFALPYFDNALSVFNGR